MRHIVIHTTLFVSLLGGFATAQQLASTSIPASAEYSSSKPNSAVTNEAAATTSEQTASDLALLGITPDCSLEKNANLRACNFHWKKALSESFLFQGVEHLGNIPTYHLQGKWLHNYFKAVKHQRFSRWSDDDPITVDYVGHPMSGATYGLIEIQNNPHDAKLEFSNTRQYWESRGKAMAWAAVWSAEWEIGPFSEASFGPLGKDKYWSNTAHKYTNGTGVVDFVMTPVGGATWIVGEDIMDKYVVKKLEARSQNRLYLFGLSILTPNHATANLARFKAPWFRDSRDVRNLR